MFKLEIPPFEMFDESSNSFIGTKETITFKMENSLYAISLWEQKYKKPYFPKKDPGKFFNKQEEKKEEKTVEEMIYFFKCMVIGVTDPDEEISDNVFLGLTEKNYKDLYEYLQDSRSAFVSGPLKDKNKSNGRTLVSEVFYAWMSELQIPWEAQYWNINRLLNVIQIVNEDNQPPDKKKKQKAYERMKEWDKINEERRKSLGTKG